MAQARGAIPMVATSKDTDNKRYTECSQDRPKAELSPKCNEHAEGRHSRRAGKF